MRLDIDEEVFMFAAHRLASGRWELRGPMTCELSGRRRVVRIAVVTPGRPWRRRLDKLPAPRRLKLVG
jgi:hypothetical protein